MTNDIIMWYINAKKLCDRNKKNGGKYKYDYFTTIISWFSNE